jgi:hypothetical protein
MWNRKSKPYVVLPLALALGFSASVHAQDHWPLDNNGAVPNAARTTTYSQAWLRISAFTDVPISRGTVDVYDTSGTLLLEEYSATNDQGVYPVKMKKLPRNFRVTVTSDEGEEETLGSVFPDAYTLSAEVRNFDPTMM